MTHQRCSCDGDNVREVSGGKVEGIATSLLRKLQQKNKSNPPKLNDDEQKILDEMREKYAKSSQSPVNHSSHAMVCVLSIFSLLMMLLCIL